MPRVSHDDPDRVLACRHCDHAGDIYQRTGNGNAHVGDPEAEFRCQKCGATFDEPVDRPAREWKPGAKNSEAGQNGSARTMAELSVDQFDAIVNGGEPT